MQAQPFLRAFFNICKRLNDFEGAYDVMRSEHPSFLDKLGRKQPLVAIYLATIPVTKE